MTKVNKILLILILLCTLLLSVLLPITAYAFDSLAFDKSNVMDDLKESKDFNALLYPFVENGQAKILNFIEYCYSPYQNKRDNYGLYLYIYNPSQKLIVTNDARNTVQIKTGETDGIATYEKFKLKYLNKSEDKNKPNRFYKFKIMGTEKLGKLVNADERCYEVSGFEVVYKDNQTPTDNPVGGTYKFTGFAKGYGYDTDAESSLKSTVAESEYIRIKDLAFTTSLSENNNENGVGHYNQFNSVYWTMPSYFEDKYGNLQKINFEYYEYKTSPILVTSDSDLYQKAYNSRAQRAELFKNNSDIPYDLHYGKVTKIISNMPYHAVTNYDWVFNREKSNQPTNAYGYSKSSSTQIPIVFERSKLGDGSLDVSSKVLLKYIYDYNASSHDGYLSHRNISKDLFLGKVDKGHTEGYNNKWIDASDIVNLLEYDLNNGWNKFWYKLFGAKPNSVSNTWTPIRRITNVDDLNALKIGDNEKEHFKSMYNGLSKDSYMYLFTFALSDYFSSYVGFDSTSESAKKAYIAETTAFLDFDLITFTFCKKGKYTSIPVVSDPIDVIGNVFSPKDPKGFNWLLFLVILVIVIIFVIIFWPIIGPILGAIVKLILFIICLPFKLIGYIFKSFKKE